MVRMAQVIPPGPEIFAKLASLVLASKTTSSSNISSTFIPGMFELLTLYNLYTNTIIFILNLKLFCYSCVYMIKTNISEALQ